MMNNNNASKSYPVVGYPSIDQHHHHQLLYPLPSGSGPSAYPVHGGPYYNQHHPGPCYPPDQFNQYNNYQQQQQYMMMPAEVTKEPSSFIRTMMLLMFVLVGSMCMMSLVMWFLFGTYIPQFEVVSLKLSNFIATDTSLTGTWDAKLTVKNYNDDTIIRFDQVRSSMYYREAMLGISSSWPFEVEKKQSYDFHTSVTAENSSTLIVDKMDNSVLPYITEDRRNGIVVFSLRLSVKTNFSSPHFVYRQESLRVMCKNMHIRLASPNGTEGTLEEGMATPCFVRLRDSLVTP